MERPAPFARISHRLSRAQSTPPHNPGPQRPAAVALILRETGNGMELLFIERAHHPDDPWSGNIGLPGGRMDPTDADLRTTAERETREEVGIDLQGAGYLGSLSDVVGHNLPVRVACFVYGLTSAMRLSLSDEVHDAFWFDMEELWAPERQVMASFSFDGRTLEAPAIRLGPHRPVLWGITYRLVSQFRQLTTGEGDGVIPYELAL